jgi:hypothetical protein
MTDVRYSHLAVERLTPQYRRVTFDHGPINTITADMVTLATAQPDPNTTPGAGAGSG